MRIIGHCSMVRVTALACVAVGLLGMSVARGEETLRVMSFGGSYQDAQRESAFKPFEKATGIKIEESTWFADLGKIRAMVEAKNVTTDIILGDVAHALTGCDEGFLEPLDGKAFGDPSDYLPGTISDCGIPTELVSIVYAYNEDKVPAAWGSARPQTIADMFDTKKFPGKRAFSVRVLGGLIEKVLLADGVAPADIYKVLSTKEGLDRMFAKLDSIKSDIIFYTSNAQPLQLLASGEAAIIQSSNGRIWSANATDNKHFVAVWDGQVWYPDVWFVPKGGNKELAVKFLQFITQPQIMADLTKYIPYAPVRKSALAYVSDKMKPDLSTTHDLSHGVRSDMVWWSTHEADINTRFQTWMATK